jgi:phosphohistidine phosphatase
VFCARQASAGVAPSLILTSPTSARCKPLSSRRRFWSTKGELLRTKALEPGVAPKAVWDEIRVHKDEARILLAGHEPLFSRLTAYLLGSPNLQVDFKKGACIEVEHGVHRAGAVSGRAAWRAALDADVEAGRRDCE